jgi:hypothetical protein
MLYLAPLLTTVLVEMPPLASPWLETVRGAMAAALSATALALLVVGRYISRARPIAPVERRSHALT